MTKGGLVRFSECAPNPCEFPIVDVGDEYEDPTGLILPGMRVMLPCENCGIDPNTHMGWLDDLLLELEAALKTQAEHKNIPLFHWSPSKNRNGISRRGLVPNRKPVTHSGDLMGWRAPYICFGSDPAWAWALSGNMRGAPEGEWDLWQTWWEQLVEPEVLASSVGDGIHEVRTGHRVYKRSIRYLGTRIK